MRHSIIIALTICSFALHAQIPNIAKRFTSDDGTKIYFEVFGEGKPVILVHGFTNTGESWKSKAVFNDLLKNNFQVIILDQRGNGKSDKPHNKEAYLNDAEAKDIMKLADTLQLNKYTALGYSRGAIIVSRLLVLDKRIDRAVMGGMGSAFTNPEWPRRIMFYEVLAGKRVEPQLDGFMKYVQDAKFDQEVLALQQLGQPSTSAAELGNIKNRVMIICGDKDQDNGSAEELALMLPNSHYMSVPGDHNHAHQTKEFSESVLGFLQAP